MSDRSVKHGEFELERVYSASPPQVFAAFADREAKERWFAAPTEWGRSQYELDFRVGGREVNKAATPGGSVHTFDAVYRDIVDDERIVYTYEMYRDDALMSVSLATVELLPEDDGTHLILTESGVFFDGRDKPIWREEGTNNLLDALGAVLGGTMSDE